MYWGFNYLSSRRLVKGTIFFLQLSKKQRLVIALYLQFFKHKILSFSKYQPQVYI